MTDDQLKSKIIDIIGKFSKYDIVWDRINPCDLLGALDELPMALLTLPPDFKIYGVRRSPSVGVYWLARVARAGTRLSYERRIFKDNSWHKIDHLCNSGLSCIFPFCESSYIDVFRELI